MSLKGKNILVIDDDENLRFVVRNIVESVGANVTEAGSVADAWKIICQAPPHLIISDINMPDASGFDLVQKINEHGFLDNMPVMFVSGYAENYVIQTALSLGVHDFIVKPFTTNTLLRKVRKKLFQKSNLQYIFPIDAPMEIEALLDAELIHIRETGARIQGLVKLKMEEEVSANCPVFDGLNIRLKVAPSLKRYSIASSYLNDVTFTGIDEKGALKIRQRVASWRQN